MTDKKELSIATFEPIRSRFIELTNEPTFLKEASFALQLIGKTKKLKEADTASIIQSVLNVSQTGLTLNPIAKLAYLVPRRQDGKVVCCLDPSYQGLVKLITDTGSVKNIYAHIIYENDVFEQTLGTSPEIIHKPKLKDRGKITGVYAVAILSDDRKQLEVMNMDEIYAVRDMSESYKAYINKYIDTCTWVTSEGEMARKTVIRRIAKYLPKTDKWEKINAAIDLDNQDYKITSGQSIMIQSLIESSNWSDDKKEYVLSTLDDMSYKEAAECIADLKGSQVDRINSGANYNQGDIKKKLKEVG